MLQSADRDVEDSLAQIVTRSKRSKQSCDTGGVWVTNEEVEDNLGAQIVTRMKRSEQSCDTDECCDASGEVGKVLLCG